MSSDALRQWLKLLHERHGWPWETLARTLGIGEGKHVVSKVRGNSRFVGGEQKRCTRQLRRIISGELVLAERRNSQGGKRCDAVIADNPQPIRGAHRMAIDLRRGGLVVRRREPLPQPTLLSFKTALTKFLNTLSADTDQ
jgi:hypothetical protein